MLHVRTIRSVGHIPPCLPSRAGRPPSGPEWLHEIKHDGFRILARRDANGVRLYTRNGYDFAGRFPHIAEAVSKFKVRSCCIDGEAIVVNERGLSAFDLLRSWRHDHAAILCAFDLIELDGEDLRRIPIEHRKAKLVHLVGARHPGIVVNQHYDADGAIIFEHACALGCEGIVSKRLGSPYRSGRVEHWLKIKNPVAPAVKREEEEEDWGNRRWSHAHRLFALTD
jgi:bifunctional non-homologous end joining protein LigD